ncbi:type 1 glutamine amidotransferase [Pseudomonas akapageensis]|uniref:type 1 glutamine amidotransferase n=1 Tax=Pseudomonas akapageensis TaxID=2609961 RepID=UPI00140772E4|nr:type 1 glutamine amidotransferase [Pseudomonas akapageensis]
MSQKLIRICILENGRTPDDLIDQFGSYPMMIEKWLSPFLPEATFTYLSPVSGDRLPSPSEFDGYILSGSKYSTYERSPWMLALIAFLQQLRQERIPVFGICFGHQIMADAYGGLNAKSEKGWGVGSQHYEYDAQALPASTHAYVFHQDQVQKVPPEATRVGGSSHCENGVFAYSFPAISVQYHPEFSAEYTRVLAEKFRGDLLPEQVSANALDSVNDLPVDATPIAKWVAGFFQRHVNS